MDRGQIKGMDPYMLLSMMNMKLRDEFEDLDDLCGAYDLAKEEVVNKLKRVGYSYSEKHRQFISNDAAQ